MDLWIRSQDKVILIKVGILMIEQDSTSGRFGILNYLDTVKWFRLGIYNSKERAFEVLDEIQSKMKEQFIVKSHAIMTLNGIDREEKRLKWKYDKEFIMEDPSFEFTPINAGIIVYEMPKE